MKQVDMRARPRYQNAEWQRLYDGMLTMAADPASELYYNGKQRRGANIRCAFWDGFNGMTRSANAVPGTPTMVCFRAGKERKRRLAMIERKTVKLGRPCLPEDERMVVVTSRMTVSQRVKLAVLGGGGWVRAQIDAAPMPRDSTRNA